MMPLPQQQAKQTLITASYRHPDMCIIIATSQAPNVHILAQNKTAFPSILMHHISS